MAITDRASEEPTPFVGQEQAPNGFDVPAESIWQDVATPRNLIAYVVHADRGATRVAVESVVKLGEGADSEFIVAGKEAWELNANGMRQGVGTTHATLAVTGLRTRANDSYWIARGTTADGEFVAFTDEENRAEATYGTRSENGYLTTQSFLNSVVRNHPDFPRVG